MVGKSLDTFYRSSGGQTTLYSNEAEQDLQDSNKYIGIQVDLSNAVGATVNQLRQAFAIQKYYEKDALYGSRYIESVRAHFGVVNPDFRVQRSEYLGGKRYQSILTR